MSDRLAIGGNNPPAHEAFALALEDAYATAKDFLDGAAIENQGQADSIGRIISEVKKIRKDADAARAEEKKPHDEAAKAVQTKWKPILDRADTIVTAATAPLTAYLNKLAAEQAEAERVAREAADAKAQAAIAAQREAASSGNIESIEAAKALQDEASAAEKAAKRAGKAKAHVTGVDRAVGLRTYDVVTVTDSRAALLWIAKNDKAAIDAFVADYARRAACPAAIDGVIVNQERRVA